MRIGRLEFLAMNNPLRQLMLKYKEFPIFLELLRVEGIDLAGQVLMDAGCGSGYSTKLLLDAFTPHKVLAFDLMPEQIAIARRRKLNVDFFVGDLTRLDVPEETCDAAFVFGVLHHVTDWRKALSEISRTLKPGGLLLFEEPRARFSWSELESGIGQAGLSIVGYRRWLLGYFRSYMCRK